MRVIYTFALLFLSFVSAQGAIGIATEPGITAKSENENRKRSLSKETRVTQMKRFLLISSARFHKQTGKKQNILKKAAYRISQKRISKMLLRYEYGEVTTLQKISWLLRGLILGPIAVLLAYLFLVDDERDLIKWAWFGFAGWAVILALIFLV